MTAPWSQTPETGLNYKVSVASKSGPNIDEYIAIPTSADSINQAAESRNWLSFNDNGPKQALLFVQLDNTNGTGVSPSDFDIGFFYYDGLPAFTGLDQVTYNQGDTQIRIMYSKSTGIPTVSQLADKENLILVKLTGNDLFVGAPTTSPPNAYNNLNAFQNPVIVYLGTNITLIPDNAAATGPYNMFNNLTGIGGERTTLAKNPAGTEFTDASFKNLTYNSYEIKDAKVPIEFGDWYLQAWTTWTGDATAEKKVIGQIGSVIDLNGPAYVGQVPGKFTLKAIARPFNSFNWSLVAIDGNDLTGTPTFFGLTGLTLYSSRPGGGVRGSSAITQLSPQPYVTINNVNYYFSSTIPGPDPDELLSSTRSVATVFVKTGATPVSDTSPPGTNLNNQVLVVGGNRGGSVPTNSDVKFDNYITASSGGKRIPYFYLFDVNMEESTNPNLVAGSTNPSTGVASTSPGQQGAKFLMIISDFTQIMWVDTTTGNFKFSSTSTYLNSPGVSSMTAGTNYMNTYGYWTTLSSGVNGFYLIYVPPVSKSSTGTSTSIYDYVFNKSFKGVTSPGKTFTLNFSTSSTGMPSTSLSAAGGKTGSWKEEYSAPLTGAAISGTFTYTLTSPTASQGDDVIITITSEQGSTGLPGSPLALPGFGTSITYQKSTYSITDGVSVLQQSSPPIAINPSTSLVEKKSTFVAPLKYYLLTASAGTTAVLTSINDITSTTVNAITNRVLFTCMQCTPYQGNIGGACTFTPSPPVRGGSQVNTSPLTGNKI
jgi:hypothetical protein